MKKVFLVFSFNEIRPELWHRAAQKNDNRMTMYWIRWIQYFLYENLFDRNQKKSLATPESGGGGEAEGGDW